MLGLCAFLGIDCEFHKIEPDTQSGIHILGKLLSDGTLHLSPIDRQVDMIIDALASHQEFRLSLCTAVDEAHRHTDVDGLSGALRQVASATYTTHLP